MLLLFEAAGRVYALDAALIVGAVGLAGGVAHSWCSASARKPGAAALALLAAVVAVNWTFVVRVLPEFERYKPVPAFSRALLARLQPGDIVAHYQVSLPSMVYYLRPPRGPVRGRGAVRAARSSSARRVYAVLSADDYAALRAADRGAHLHHRSAPDVRGEAEAGPRPPAAAGTAADHEPVPDW